MAQISQAAASSGVRPDAPAVAFSVQLSRDLIVQVCIIAMAALSGLTVSPWPWVLGWTVVAVAAAAAEDQFLRVAAKGRSSARIAGGMAPAMRMLTNAIYAIAALALIIHGSPSTRLFAFALMACSMVYVLMRYYRSPAIVLSSISPHVAILAIVGYGIAAKELAVGHILMALTGTFTIGIFALLFWSARAQLATSWSDLMQARNEAEEREAAAAAANRAKSHFLTTMSHELRTPLNGVLGMAQALTNDRLTDIQRERVKIISRSGESLLAVLNDLLDLSKIEASTLELEIVEFDLEHLVRGVVAAFRGEAHKKGLTFDFMIEDTAAGAYHGDATRIKRILYNLSSNAVKFTQEGRITLSIDRDDRDVIFRVTDTGIGIEAKHLAHLFDDFFQVDPSLSRVHGGSGLGLAICRDLTRLMGGTIEAGSEPGHGATFTLRLPLQPVEAALQTPEATAGQEETPDLRVLVAEDNETNRQVLKTLLAQAGVTPTFAVDGAEAVAHWERQAWDVILMDIQMPGMDGVAATRAIRQREAETGRPRTPIVAVTANAMTHQLADYAAAGMDEVVAKPISITRLFATMERVLEPGDTAPEAASAA
jgi:signal transduction histidine kinase/ActR/RegA family two-component response regulator